MPRTKRTTQQTDGGAQTVREFERVHADAAAAVQDHLQRVIRHARLPAVHRRVMLDSGVYLDRGAYATLFSIDTLGTASLSELANEMLLDISTVSRQIRRLEDLGIVERSVHPDDRRVSVVTATAAGKAVASKIGAAWQRAFSEALVDWSNVELQSLATNLDGLADALRNFAG
jgi:DNA-binding MarR family transcriptional regulator